MQNIMLVVKSLTHHDIKTRALKSKTLWQVNYDFGQRNSTTGVSGISRSKTFSDTHNFVDTTCIPLRSVPWCFGSAVNTL